MGRRVIAGVVVVALLVALVPVADAFIDLPIIGDPAEIAALVAIERVLSMVSYWRMRVQEARQEQTLNRLRGYAFPEELWDPIVEIFAAAQNTRQQIEALSCGWRFSQRTNLLRGIYLRPMRLCKPSLNLIWGDPMPGWDEDLQEMATLSQALSTNMISQRVEADVSWHRVFRDMYRDSAVMRKSPGEAARDTAVNIAWLGAARYSHKELLAKRNTTKELALLMERREEQGERALAIFMAESLRAGW